MRRSILYPIGGIGAVVVGVIMILLLWMNEARLSTGTILGVYQQGVAYGTLRIESPVDNVLFPPDIAPVTFSWEDEDRGSDTWLISFSFQDDSESMNFLSSRNFWIPPADQWQSIKDRSLEKPARLNYSRSKQFISQKDSVRSKHIVYHFLRSCRGAFVLSRSEPAVHRGS